MNFAIASIIAVFFAAVPFSANAETCEELLYPLRVYWMEHPLRAAMQAHPVPSREGAPDLPLSVYDKEIIKRYTGDLSFAINNALRAGEPTGKIKGPIKLLRKTLAKFPLYTGVVFRSEFVLSSDYVAIGDASSHLAEIKVGSEIVRREFLSASARADLEAMGTLSDRPGYSVILSRTGRYVSRYSKRQNEREVLFLPGTRFKVLKAEHDDGRYYFLLEEI